MIKKIASALEISFEISVDNVLHFSLEFSKSTADSLYFSMKLMITCQTTNLVHIQIVQSKIRTKLAFLNNFNHVWEMFRKRQVWSRFFSESGQNLPLRTIWKWTDFVFWHVIINFEEKESGPNLPFRSKFHTWFWTPSNTFLDQNIRHK